MNQYPRSMKKLHLIFLFSILFKLVSAEEIPVLSYLQKNHQSDSIKGNLLNILPDLLYGKILNGQVILWDSPKKQIKISAESLKNIENASRTKFSESINLFIYENWNIKKKEVENKIIGLAFTNKDGKGEDVSYGFIDYNDIAVWMKKTPMPSGADGFYKINIDQKIKNKEYNYSILQYGSKIIKTADSKKLINETFKERKIVSDAPSIKEEKMISYSIENTSRIEGREVENSRLFFRAVEDFLKSNEEVYFNMGGQKISSHLQHTKFKVDRIEINEIWKKNDGKIDYAPESIRISVNGNFLEPIGIKELMSWNMQLGFRTADDFIKEKNFYYILFKINEQDIKTYDALKYAKALASEDWRNIIAYSKREEIKK